MALIKCPECKKKILDQCGNCPHCGYPINSNVGNVVTETLGKTNLVTDGKRPFYKTVWFWIVVGVVAITAIVTTVFLLVRDTKPKYDKEGNPLFVELTNEVYTNAKDYLGYHINIKGKVFQVMGDNGTSKGIQIWLDPDTCEQNLMIYYTSDVEVKQDDYIMCSGYIDSVTKYKNAYDTELHVPLVYSTDLKKATYIDVMAPTTETVTPENLKQEKFGYSVSIDKIEFSEKETRVYATVTNNGKALMNVGDAVIVQDGKQYNSESNYEANYDEIPYEIVKGASSSGIIVFPPISNNNFELTIDVHSDDFDEELEKFVFNVSGEVNATQKQEENKQVEDTSSNQATSTTENKNQQAVTKAKEIAETYATVYPNMVKELLMNDYGFSESQAIYGVQNSGIDWNYYAVIHLEEYVGINNGKTTQADAKRHLGADKGYTESAIQYALGKANVNWNSNENSANTGKTPATVSAAGSYTGHSSECTFSLVLNEDGSLLFENVTSNFIITRGTWSQQGSTISFHLKSDDGMWDDRFQTTLYSDGMQFMDFYYTRN